MLYSNPTKWAKKLVGSKWRLALMVLTHWGALGTLCFLRATVLHKETDAHALLFFGALFPSIYLYALFHLIQRVNELESRATSNSSTLPNH